jgi:hypothetical protein
MLEDDIVKPGVYSAFIPADDSDSNSSRLN